MRTNCNHLDFLLIEKNIDLNRSAAALPFILQNSLIINNYI
jgi:hypothetical protein